MTKHTFVLDIIETNPYLCIFRTEILAKSGVNAKKTHRIQSSRSGFCASPTSGILKNRILSKKSRFGPFRGEKFGGPKCRL